jgi:elongation factor G
MQNYCPEGIRNVILLSHSGAGKTSLCEAMLFTAGAISRKGTVDEGTTTSDYEPDEVKHHMSINLSLLPCQWKGTKINLIDTPGYADFVGEVKAGIRVAEGGIVVVCASSGVEVGTELVWEYAAEEGIPSLVFINKMDRENANFYRTLEQLQHQLGERCLPIQLPIGSSTDFQGIVDLITMKAYSGAQQQEGEMPSSEEGEAQSFREKLVEAVAEINDELMFKYLDGRGISTEEIRCVLQEGVKRGKIVPILTGTALQSVAISHLLDAICCYLPSPKEAGEVVATNPITQETEAIDPNGDSSFTARVFKTTTDPYVGKVSYFRVHSGSIYSNSQVWNATKGQAERVGQLFTLRGKTQQAVPQLIAGDIGATAKLAVTGTGDTLSSREHPLILTPIEFPRPIFSVALHPKTKADVDKLGAILPKLMEEEPTLQVHKEPDTGETILSAMGDSQVEVVTERMQHKFGVEVKVEPPKVPYKETISIPVKVEYKHKKQTGGHGQYGHVFLELEPLPRGSGFEFIGKIVGGAISKKYIPAVEKGVVEALQEGVVARYPVVDLRVTLYDGSEHAVDSSDISFKIAGAHAGKKGLSLGQPILLEPIMHLFVAVPGDLTGDTINDLNTKRARVLGVRPQDGIQVIEAQVPLAEILHYTIDLRSIAQGRGNYTTEFDHYEEVPSYLAQKIIEQRVKES